MAVKRGKLQSDTQGRVQLESHWQYQVTRTHGDA